MERAGTPGAVTAQLLLEAPDDVLDRIEDGGI
jgi:hypothetical protein